MNRVLRWLDYQRTVGRAGYALFLITAVLGAAYCIIERRLYHAGLVLVIALIFVSRRPSVPENRDG